MLRAKRCVVLCCCSLFLVACGNSELNKDLTVFESDSSVEVESELRAVVSETRNAILGSVLSSLMSGSEIKLGKCKPQLNWGTGGANLEFEPSDSCKFDGTISLTLLSLAVDVDLAVVGLKFVESMRFDAEIAVFQKNGGFQLGWEFYDGRIQLKASSILPSGTLGLNGRVKVNLAEGAFSLTSRTNVYDFDSKNGLALLADVTRSQAQNLRDANFQGCVVYGCDGYNVDAGELGQCIPSAEAP